MLISPEQVRAVERFLRSDGVTYDPLYRELMDHILIDIETKMKQGVDFNDAWDSIRSDIPKQHFKHIEKETMDSTHTHNSPNRIFLSISAGLLVVATLFKLMKFPGTSWLLLGFFIFTTVALLFGSVRNVYVKKRRGGLLLVLVAASIVAIVSGWFLLTMQLTGATFVLGLSVIYMCVLYPLLSYYFYSSKRNQNGHILIDFLRSNQSLLEKAILFVIGFGLVIQYQPLLFGTPNFVGEVFMIITVILTGIYTYSLTWLYFVETKGNAFYSVRTALLIVSTIGIILFLLPAIGPNYMGPVTRNYMAYGSGIIFITIVVSYYWAHSNNRHDKTVAILSGAFLFYTIFMLGVKVGWFPESFNTLLANLPSTWDLLFYQD